MATSTYSGRIEIFKFKETGLLELCREVAESREWLLRRGVDLSTARFEERDDTFVVVFEDNVSAWAAKFREEDLAKAAASNG